MRKQFLFTGVVIAIILFSCRKEEVGVQTISSSSQEQVSQSNSSAERTVVNPLTVKLEGWFSFNGNLKDQTGKLADGIPTTRGVIYTKDRNGISKGALYLDSSYFVKIKAVPQQTHTSLSVWFKPSHVDNITAGGIVMTEGKGPMVYQSGVKLSGVVSTDVSHPGAYVDIPNTGWHHAVVTFDGSNVRVYLDNVLKATVPHSASITPALVDYVIGSSSVWPYWKGSIDDLRFYSRTLSASDVTALYNL